MDWLWLTNDRPDLSSDRAPQIAVSKGRCSFPPPFVLLVLVLWPRYGSHRKHLHYCVFSRCRGNVSTEMFRSNGCCTLTCSFIASGVELSPLYCSNFWPIVPAPDDRWGWLWSNWWNEDWQGKPKYSEKTCPSATMSTTNPTWPNPGSNPGLRDGKPASNRLSYGAALVWE
jgi:hypothetical protein